MRKILALLLLVLTLEGAAESTSDVLSRLLAIAEPDQVQALSQLRLSQEQTARLSAIADSYLPLVEKHKAEPGYMIRVVPEAWSRVEGVLTPEQRPLARRLLPRPHQWAKLRDVYRGL